MNAEIIAVGSEITTGDITDTNSAYLSKKLTELGINIVGQTVVPDNGKRIVAALATAIPRSQLIIFTGGLGPTPDDLTKETLCKAIGMPLVENEESIGRIKAYFARKGMEMAEANRKQALFPEKAIILPNSVGTADGCIIESGNQCIIMLPGPPYEMKRMYEDGVLPYITKKLDRVVLTKTLKVYGMGESTIADKLGDILKSTDPVVATYVGKGDIRIKITASGLSKAECKEK
ncbi:MAG: CinA family nicotinamide mononucleotide deamidase-related protein, partial [Clostridia bacterium]|nr:CinA family nicotinamide mononucleotide deamidase-related protein [Clostridia bacterium]